MNIQQLYTSCLAQGAYYISSEGEAAIIDPLRETQQYIDKANNDKAQIKYVFETHFHADFVSGHIDLARKTNSTIVFGPGAKTDYPCHIAKDQEEFIVGKIRIRKQGSAGGHNGIRSIIDAFGTQNFPRIRIGIGQPNNSEDQINYVLGQPTDSEKKEVKVSLKNLQTAVSVILSEGIDKAMNSFN